MGKVAIFDWSITRKYQLALINSEFTNILVCWSGRPGYVPAPKFSSNQTTVYSHHDRELPGLIDPPRKVSDQQSYQLDEALSQYLDPNGFDLVIVGCDASPNNKVQGLKSFKCPKVLMLTDTHHLNEKPVSVALDYFHSEPFDAVVSLYNRDHLRWFGNNSSIRLGWHPCLTVRNIPRNFTSQRLPQIAFVGNWRRSHARRKHLIDKMLKDDLPLVVEKLNSLGSANLYSSSLLSFNCSLNGDLNMRILEVISAGGCLITDRLAESSGLQKLFIEDQDYIAYGGYGELRDKIRYYLAHPEKAVKVAQSGLTKYRQYYQPEQLINGFVDWVIDHDQPQYDYHSTLTDCTEKERRMRLDLYERAMQIQFRNEQSDVLLIGNRALQCSEELSGLPRVHCYRLLTNPSQSNIGTAVIDVDQTQALDRTWDMVVADSGEQPHIERLKVNYNSIFTI